LIFSLDFGYLMRGRSRAGCCFTDLEAAMSRLFDIAVPTAPASTGARDRFAAPRLTLSLLLLTGPWAA
jgi:hypothetical protein